MDRVDDAGRKKNAIQLLEQAYREQMGGNLEEAIRLYQASLAYHPTAEAHTFLGWAYSFEGRFDDAIAECKKAIAVDPSFGNPYNDIGSYLIHKGQLDDAIPWLERALTATRYEPRHYPHCNLGRIYRAKGLLNKAIEEFETALAIEPHYALARDQLAEIRAQLN
jgi:tetratricopeptide (TPR) repeat protein